MATSKNKKLMNFTINSNVASIFLELSKSKCINKSMLIEKLIQDWISEIRNLDETRKKM